MSDFSDYSYLTPPANPVEFDAWLLAQEERIARKTRAALVKIIDEATEQFINSLTATGDMSAFDQVPIKWGTYVDDVLMEDIEGLFLSGGLSAYVTSPSTAIITESMADAWVNVVNQSAVDYALEASNRMKDVGQTAWNDIKNKVSKSVEAGTSTDQLRELLMENRRFSEYRAETIARTETANAYNNGDWAGQQALGEYGPTHKYWVNTSDNRTRTSHLEAPNQNKVIPVSQPFIVGGYEMMFPHSPGAPAKEVVNCRCRALYLYPGDIDPFTGEVIGESQTPSQITQPEAPQSLLDELRGTPRAGSIDPLPGEKEFIDSLTDDEIDALRRYTGADYEDLNYYLRMERSGNRQYQLTQEQRTMIELIDSAIAKAPKSEPFVTYRGMTIPTPPTPPDTIFRYMTPEQQTKLMADYLADKYPVGSRMNFGGQYVSTSTDISAPLNAAASRSNPGVIFEIEARTASALNPISKYNDEYEVLLGRNAEFEVVRIEADGSFDQFESDSIIDRVIVVLREIV